MRLTILVPDADKDLGLLLEKEEIETTFSRTGTAIVTLKENKTGVYDIPETLLKYKKIIPSINVMETNGSDFGQIVSAPDGEAIAPYRVEKGDVYFSIKSGAIIFYAKRNRLGEIRVSIDMITIKREGNTVFVDKIPMCRGDQKIPDKLIPLAKLAIGKCRCLECSRPHYVKAK